MAGTATSSNIILKESAQGRRRSAQGRRRARESRRESPAVRWPLTTSRREEVQRHAGRRRQVDEDKSSGTLAIDEESMRLSPADVGHRR